MDRANTIGEFVVPNDVQHTYTLPKNLLPDALSAQIASLSLNVSGVSCFDAITGRIQALLSLRAAARTLSERETAIASAAPVVVVPGKSEVRLA